jgi:hypothetical protein
MMWAILIDTTRTPTTARATGVMYEDRDLAVAWKDLDSTDASISPPDSNSTENAILLLGAPAPGRRIGAAQALAEADSLP